MHKFHTYEWNKMDKMLTTLILSEEDISSGDAHLGIGWEILIIPKKYEDKIDNHYVNMLRKITVVRSGKIIYV